MVETLLTNLDNLLLWVFAAFALIGSALMLVLRQPMRAATSLIATMISLGAIYGLLGVHFIAAFQVLIYVGAVMVFMVYVIMLLDTRDSAQRQRFSGLVVPGIVLGVLLIAVLAYALLHGLYAPPSGAPLFGLQQFSVDFLTDYWLQFEVTSVLLVAAVVAAIAVIKGTMKDHG
jgi:NADH-quinone oxidoreductase subunit J